MLEEVEQEGGFFGGMEQEGGFLGGVEQEAQGGFLGGVEQGECLVGLSKRGCLDQQLLLFRFLVSTDLLDV